MSCPISTVQILAWWAISVMWCSPKAMASKTSPAAWQHPRCWSALRGQHGVPDPLSNPFVGLTEAAGKEGLRQRVWIQTVRARREDGKW